MKEIITKLYKINMTYRGRDWQETYQHKIFSWIIQLSNNKYAPINGLPDILDEIKRRYTFLTPHNTAISSCSQESISKVRFWYAQIIGFDPEKVEQTFQELTLLAKGNRLNLEEIIK